MQWYRAPNPEQMAWRSILPWRYHMDRHQCAVFQRFFLFCCLPSWIPTLDTHRWFLKKKRIIISSSLSYANSTTSGLEKSAAIRPFATKKSRLASEKDLFSGQFGHWKLPFSGQFGDWKLPFSGQVGDQSFFQSGQRRCGPNAIAQGLGQTIWRSKMQGSWPFGPVDRVCE